jgi:magnesium-transporting ATPase (P-type)
VLCNDAELRLEDGGWRVEGDPTEGALYPFASKLGMERRTELEAHPRIDAIPFESEHKFMATLHEDAAGGRFILVKGAPEVILGRCDRQQRDGRVAPIDRDHFIAASDGLRRRASACWPWRGSRSRGSRRVTSARPIFRPTW